MFDIRQIVVPIDFSQASQKAAERGAQLAKECGAVVKLLHVSDVPAYVYAESQPLMISGMAFLEYSADATRKRLRKVSDQLAKEFEVEVTWTVLEGSAGSEIARAVNEMDPNHPESTLVIMPTHARLGVSRALLGSVTEKVVRRAKRPVLTLRADGDALDFSTIRKIHVPLDLSDTANESLNYALSWSQQFGAQLEIVHVLEDLSTIPSLEWSVHPEKLPTEYYRSAEAEAWNAMEAAAAAEIQDAAPTDFCVRHGYVAEEIAENAAEKDADLIILSTHGHSGFKRFILGSVAERLIRLAPCPVLVVQPQAAHASGHRHTAALAGESIG